MNELTPGCLPISEVLRNILLSNKPIPSWAEQMHADLLLELTGDYPVQPLEIRPFFLNLWPFSDMLVDDINKLSPQQLAEMISALETEDQDMLLRYIPSELETSFGNLSIIFKVVR